MVAALMWVLGCGGAPNPAPETTDAPEVDEALREAVTRSQRDCAGLYTVSEDEIWFDKTRLHGPEQGDLRDPAVRKESMRRMAVDTLKLNMDLFNQGTSHWQCSVVVVAPDASPPLLQRAIVLAENNGIDTTIHLGPPAAARALLDDVPTRVVRPGSASRSALEPRCQDRIHIELQGNAIVLRPEDFKSVHGLVSSAPAARVPVPPNRMVHPKDIVSKVHAMTMSHGDVELVLSYPWVATSADVVRLAAALYQASVHQLQLGRDVYTDLPLAPVDDRVRFGSGIPSTPVRLKSGPADAAWRCPEG